MRNAVLMSCLSQRLALSDRLSIHYLVQIQGFGLLASRCQDPLRLFGLPRAL
jgi:hypothetical protein